MINFIGSIVAIENFYEIHKPEILPSTPNTAALQVEYCSVLDTVTVRGFNILNLNRLFSVLKRLTMKTTTQKNTQRL